MACTIRNIGTAVQLPLIFEVRGLADRVVRQRHTVRVYTYRDERTAGSLIPDFEHSKEARHDHFALIRNLGLAFSRLASIGRAAMLRS